MKKDVMREYYSKREDNLEKAILETVAYYQPIVTIDIWYELDEDERFEGFLTRSEVDEVLSQLERQNLIKKGKDEKWIIKKSRQRSDLLTANHSDH